MRNTNIKFNQRKNIFKQRKEVDTMKKLIGRFLHDQRGVNTLEILIIAAVLVAVALLFRTQLMDFVQQIMGPIFGSADKITEGIEGTTTAMLSLLS